MKNELKLFLATAMIQLGFPYTWTFRRLHLTTTQQWVAMHRAGITKKLRQKILRRDKYTCYLCGRWIPRGTVWHLEHKIPLSRGGDNKESNLGASHALCNLRKGVKLAGI